MLSTDPCLPSSRRHALKTLSSGFGYLAFASLESRAAQASAASRGGALAPRASHFPARAKRVILLCMRGGPSHVDTFDYKPKLSANSGAPGTRPGTKLLGSKWQFAQHGQSGLWISDLFPKVARHADDLCVIRSMQTDLPAHPQAFLQLHTGSFQFVRPSLGAWTLYGLGTENENLPGFVTITPSGASGGRRTTVPPSCLPSIRVPESARKAGPSRERKSATSSLRLIPPCNAPSSTWCRRSTARRSGTMRSIPPWKG